MRRARTIPFALLAAATAACAASDPAGLRLVEGTEIVFLVQSERPDAVMEALFQGPVVRDAGGCLRLGAADGPTAVWPFGFTLTSRSGDLVVRDEGGREVGAVGGFFRLGGGNVGELHEGIPLTDADRELARARCPGGWWIVGDVPRT